MKVLLVGLLLVGLLFPHWEQFQGKGWPYRCLLYLLPALLIPLIWQLRGRGFPYPHRVDALLVAPFMLDTAGNVGNFFDTVRHFDDVLHFLNWLLLTAAVGTALTRWLSSRLNVAALCVGFGATAIVLWEIMEWLLQESGSFGLQLTYFDTISDLALSFAGGCVAAILTVTVLWPSRRTE